MRWSGQSLHTEVSNQPLWEFFLPEAAGSLSDPTFILELHYGTDGKPLIETASIKMLDSTGQVVDLDSPADSTFLPDARLSRMTKEVR